jgi:O-antigen/teichoic acid export membrane protein
MNSLSMIARLLILAQHKGFRRYFANTSWLFAEKTLRMVVGLVVGVWVARYLGPERYGLFSYAQSFVGLFSVVATLGLDSILVRELVKDESKRDILLGTAFRLKLLGAAAVMMLLAAGVQLTSNDGYTNALVFIVASATVFQSFNVIDLYFQSRVLSKYVALANTASLALLSLLKIACILLRAPLAAFAFLVLLDGVVLAAGFVFFYRRKNLSVSAWRFDTKTAKSLLTESWPLILSGGALMIQARIDQVMIREMLGNAETAYYSVALRLIEALGFIPVVLHSSLFPALAKAKYISEKLYQNRYLNYYRLSFFLFLLTATPIYLFSGKIIVILYGEAYQPAGVLLSLMATRLFFTNIGTARSAFINIESLFKYSLFSMITGTIVNVVFNFILIPSYGSAGAVIATIFSFSTTIFFLDTFYRKTRSNVKLQLLAIASFYKIFQGVACVE